MRDTGHTLFGLPIYETEMATPEVRLATARLPDMAPPPIRDNCAACGGLGWIIGEWRHPLGFTARVRRCDCR